MSESEAFAKTQFRLSGHLFFIVFGIMFIAIETLLGQLFYLTLERGILLILGLGIALTAIALFARRLVDAVLGRCGMMMPTIVLWMYPLATLALTWLLSWVLLKVVPDIAGRGCWTGLLRLNAKTVTGAFNGPFLSFFLVILAWTLVEAWRYLRWSIGWADFVTQLSAEGGLPPVEVMAQRRERQREIEADREKARHWNRWATLAVFAGMIGAFVWITFFRPELILYYRGMAQLRTFQKPEAALAAFEQLIRKYPDYRYADSVKYYIAWVEERRLNRFADAARSYEVYLREYGSDNVWADDVLANLVRLSLDKLNDPAAALRWTAEYRRTFPEGIMAPHVALYEIRALMALGRTDEARTALAAARSRFGATDVIIYDSEDDYAGRIPFEAAAAALGL
ncbi:MAG: hypothetical protein BWY66_02703 [bacterium ADurb.Bin374]|nr:MAG: hypothetical protein BWY66_02703 [bacterium ADurb.Bin374]